MFCVKAPDPRLGMSAFISPISVRVRRLRVPVSVRFLLATRIAAANLSGNAHLGTADRMPHLLRGLDASESYSLTQERASVTSCAVVDATVEWFSFP